VFSRLSLFLIMPKTVEKCGITLLYLCYKPQKIGLAREECRPDSRQHYLLLDEAAR